MTSRAGTAHLEGSCGGQVTGCCTACAVCCILLNACWCSSHSIPPLPLQANAKAKFDETVEIALNLGVDPRRGDQNVRGTVILPHGTGKSVKVAVFAEGEDADAARAAGTCSTLCSTLCWTRK